jgi:hypothetical protein
VAGSLIMRTRLGYIKVARLQADGDLDAATMRLRIEGVPYFAVLTTELLRDSTPRHVFQILVSPDSEEYSGPFQSM